MKKNTIQYDVFSQLDLRIGKIVSAEVPEGSQKLMLLNVDLGEEYGVVEILAGIAQKYQPSDVVGKKYIFLANLEPKQMMNKISHGMLIAASVEDLPALIEAPDDLAIGTLLC